MAGRRLHVLMLCAVLAATPVFAQTPAAQESGTEKPAEPKRNSWFGGRKKADRAAANSPEFDNVRKAIEALTPEQQKRFRQNFERWVNLPPEEKRALRDRDELRRKRMTEEIESAIGQAGLQLEGERRVKFAKRYAEERRRLEEQLRREMDEKRKPLVQEIIGKLKTEFSESVPATAAP